MIGSRVTRQIAAASNGFCWPRSGTSTPDQIDSPFGPRRFPPYIIVTGYDYDFHRGDDIEVPPGGNVYATMAGAVARATMTYFGWQTGRQLTSYWQASGSGALFSVESPTTLRITGERVGLQTFAAAARLVPLISNMLVDPSTGRWETRAWFTTIPAVTGGVFFFGIYDPLTNERALLEYDGTTLTVVAVGSGGPLGTNGTSVAVSAKFLDIYYDFAGVVNFRYTNDPTQATWTTLAAQAGWAAALTNKNRQCWIATVGWRSIDTSLLLETTDVDFFGFWDNNGVPKFGNTIQIMSSDAKMLELHNQELLVFPGDIVDAGDLVALGGDTGFDEFSGLNLDTHVHVEYSTPPDFFYGDYQGQNPNRIMPDFRDGILPRSPPSSVTAVITDEADPDGVPSWKLTYTVQRLDQAFDVNEITFVGSAATRIRNYNTSVGQDPVDFRTPKFDGIFSFANPFDNTSPTLVAGAYFNKAVVGAGAPVSAEIRDPNGLLLWSFP